MIAGDLQPLFRTGFTTPTCFKRPRRDYTHSQHFPASPYTPDESLKALKLFTLIWATVSGVNMVFMMPSASKATGILNATWP
jgi:hypothetical protein